MNQQSMTRKQHYVPRFYLERFSDQDGFLHIYDTKHNKLFKQRPENFGYKKDIYEVRWEGSNRKYMLTNQIEHIFADYENQFAQFLKRLDSVCHLEQNPKALICSKADKAILYKLIANFYLRTPETMSLLAADEIPKEIAESDFLAELRRILNHIGLGGADEIVKLAHKSICLTDRFDNGPMVDICRETQKLNFNFFRAQNNSFLTSNQPALAGFDYSINKDNNQVFSMTLSPKLFILFGNYTETKKMKNRMIIIQDDIVDAINRIIFNDAVKNGRYVISHTKELIKRYR